MDRNIAQEQATYIKNMRWTVSLFKGCTFILLVIVLANMVSLARRTPLPDVFPDLLAATFLALVSYSLSQVMGFLANLGERVERLSLYAVQQREILMDK